MLAHSEKLLAVLASLRAGRAEIELPRLHGIVAAAIAEFDEEMRKFYPEEQVKRAVYAVCALADDIALNLPQQEQQAAEWATRSMAVRYFQENIGGDRFWLLLEQMIQNPGDFADLIELYHACMACGFEGRYRVAPNGKAEHRQMMQRAFDALEHPRALSSREVSPHWRGVPTEIPSVGFWSVLALAASAACLTLVAVYFVLRASLGQLSTPAVAAVNAINPEEPLQLARAAAPLAVPQSTLLQRIAAFLAPEIMRGQVEVFEDATGVRVRSLIPEQFRTASAELQPRDVPLYQRVAAALDAETGAVRVEGFTDSLGISSLRFPDNVALSQGRAGTVADLLRRDLRDARRVTAQGFGNAQPIASNATAEGRARNRRVEIVIARDAG
jgi:type VI secretion system protein ImpK